MLCDAHDIFYYVCIPAQCLVMLNRASNYHRELAKCCYTQNLGILTFIGICFNNLLPPKRESRFFFFF